ncbi:hypothetical protein QTQ03_25305 [Micromonospora sp. WMMA1363]|uniref:hypothetical protein n=1 Tax=Micromonospora sp. WMMA1363 TaxID=3053985 RepID=UPI00259D03CF|nr:hypothetical protein [Micromonospora sp. WMMA1363]MDM4722753.1 hypothetical protein [Micromonospora sp. WMMA1363]
MDLDAVIEGLAGVVAAAIPGLTAYDYAAEAIVEPAFLPGDVTVEFDRTFGRGMDAITIKPIVLVGRSDDRAAQKKLNDYLSGSGLTSLKQVIEASPTLGGACHDLRVVRVTGRRLYTFGDTQFTGAELEIFVVGSGS